MLIYPYLHDKKTIYKLLIRLEHLNSANLNTGNPFELTQNKKKKKNRPQNITTRNGREKRKEELSTCNVKPEYFIFSQIHLFLLPLGIFCVLSSID